MTLIDSGEIGEGQNVWQSLGGMEVGSVWGHGSYVAPDWTADWLHREAVFILDKWANGGVFQTVCRTRPGASRPTGRATVRASCTPTPMMKRPASSRLIRCERKRLPRMSITIRDVFIDGNADYAIPAGAVSSEERLRKLSSFFFWTSWAAVDNSARRHRQLHQQLAA